MSSRLLPSTQKTQKALAAHKQSGHPHCHVRRPRDQLQVVAACAIIHQAAAHHTRPAQTPPWRPPPAREHTTYPGSAKPSQPRRISFLPAGVRTA